MTPFYIGQKVVCIDDSVDKDRRFGAGLHGLTAGQVYTIRGIEKPHPLWVRKYPDLRSRVWIHLEEIKRPLWKPIGIEVGYKSTRFRPLIETDISVFTSMLNTKPALIDA